MLKLTIAPFLASTLLLANTTFYVGKTYDFAEADMIDAIQSHIQQNKSTIEKKFESMKEHSLERMKQLSPTLKNTLPFATKDREFYALTRYTNPHDIKDAHGKILYKAGYSYEPMDYLSLPYAIVFINANRDAEIQWVKESGMLDSANYRILITEGTYAHASNALGQHVFFANDHIINRMNIEATPSIALQERNHLKIKEVCVEKCLQTN